MAAVHESRPHPSSGEVTFDVVGESGTDVGITFTRLIHDDLFSTIWFCAVYYAASDVQTITALGHQKHGDVDRPVHIVLSGFTKNERNHVAAIIEQLRLASSFDAAMQPLGNKAQTYFYFTRTQ